MCSKVFFASVHFSSVIFMKLKFSATDSMCETAAVLRFLWVTVLHSDKLVRQYYYYYYYYYYYKYWLWDPLKTLRAVPERFWGGVSRKGAIPSVRNAFTFTCIYTPWVKKNRKLYYCPIDYKIWDIIQQRVQSTKVQGVKDIMMQHLIDAWAGVEASVIQDVIHHRCRRLHNCIQQQEDVININCDKN